MMKLILFFLVFTSNSYAQDENSLLSACKKPDLVACEKLAGYYTQESEWDKAFIVSELLCEKNVLTGCTYAGMARLGQKKVEAGMKLLNKACDQFEPHACRSLGKLVKRSDEALAYVYFKRACHFGLSESCRSLKKPKTTYSPAGLALIKKIQSDCSDPAFSTCQEHLASLGPCHKPLTKQDCRILPGELSIYFRAKLMQQEARLSLMTINASQKKLKENPTGVKGYSYNLTNVLKDFKPLENYHYVFGFLKACRKKYGKKNWKTNTLELFPDSYKSLSGRIKANITNYFESGKQTDCYDPRTGYYAFAVASLDPLHPRLLDVWKTNQDGNLIQVSDGLPLFN